MKKISTLLPVASSVLHSTYSKSYNIIYDQIKGVIHVPKTWLEDIKHLEFNELLASSLGPLALFFGWNKKEKEDFFEIASGTLTSSVVYGDPLTSLTVISVLAYRYSKNKNANELRNLKWGVIKGTLSVGAFVLATKAMGFSALSFLIGTCAAFAVKKSVTALRLLEYLNFLKSIKIKHPKLKKNLSRRDFITLQWFTYKGN